jgi:hypothetical protein
MQWIPILFRYIRQKEMNSLKETTFWAVGRICQYYHSQISPTIVADFEKLMEEALQEPGADHFSHISWVLGNYLSQPSNFGIKRAYPLQLLLTFVKTGST